MSSAGHDPAAVDAGLDRTYPTPLEHVADGSMRNSRDGVRPPRAISLICSMLATSSAKSFLFT